MNKFVILTAATALCCALTGCRSHKVLTHIEQSDSTRTEFREQVSYLPDTVQYKLPPQTAERITPDSVSHLETDYAVSEAAITENGLLRHTLTTKQTTLAVPTLQKQTTRDSVVYRDRVITQTKTIEKGLSLWQKRRFGVCGGLLALVVITYK